jgi:hypothetical protein
MPINYKKYPENWKSEIRPMIMKRSKGKCEACGIRNYSVGYRDESGRFVGTCGNIIHDLAGEGLSYPSLKPISYKEAKEIADMNNEYDDDHYIVIVLTIAHLDHDVNNNNPSNLRALCQRCHNRHDINFRKANRKSNQLKLYNP